MSCSFRWANYQLVEIRGCIPARLRHALANLPETLDERYERTLREISKAKRGFAHRLFQSVAVSVQDKDSQSQTPLHLAPLRQTSQVEGARMPIERDAMVSESAQNKDAPTPLHLVFLENWNHPEVARILVERGADVSARDKDSQTFSHPASQEEQPPEAARRMLIERGASVSAQNKDGQTPLHLVFLSNCDPHPPLDTSGHREVARMPIEDVSAQDKDGQTPLHLASRAGQLEVARVPIEHGAGVSVQNQ
jgi:ankyrin repeat protein